uniref:Putative ovule protein n=1 Tax=Solanum chacoense TaxID=4108 RepID=A0A0V0HG26_SOLCH
MDFSILGLLNNYFLLTHGLETHECPLSFFSTEDLNSNWRWQESRFWLDTWPGKSTLMDLYPN